MEEAHITQLKRDDTVMTGQLAKANVDLKHKDYQLDIHAKSTTALQIELDSTSGCLQKLKEGIKRAGSVEAQGNMGANVKSKHIRQVNM